MERLEQIANDVHVSHKIIETLPETSASVRSLWKYPAYISDSKYSQHDFKTKLSQKSMLGILYFKKWREEVVYNDKTLLAMFEGKHRAGKSMSAITLACLIDKTFWLYFDKRVVQTPKEFMDALRVIEKEKIKGAVIVVDEAAVSMGSDSWYESWMKCLEKAVVIFGMWNPLVFFCSPQKDFVGAKLRKMAHFYVKINRYSKKETTLKIYEMEWNTILKDYIYRKPDVSLFGKKIRIRAITVTMPPQIIVDRYRAIERIRKPIIMESLAQDIDMTETQQKLSKKDLNVIVDAVVENYKQFISSESKDGKIRLDQNIISFKYESLKDKALRQVRSRAMVILNSPAQEAKRLVEKEANKPKELSEQEKVNKERRRQRMFQQMNE